MADLMITASAYTATANGATLTVDLVAGERNSMQCDTTGAQRGGGLVQVENEVIYYGIFDPSEPGVLYDLYRGQNGTIEDDHHSGAAVTIFGYEKGMLSLFAHVLNLEKRVQDLGG